MHEKPAAVNNRDRELTVGLFYGRDDSEHNSLVDISQIFATQNKLFKFKFKYRIINEDSKLKGK